MKKLFMIIVMSILSIITYAQEHKRVEITRNVSDLMIQYMDGIKVKEDYDRKGGYMSIYKLPSFYNIDVVVVKLRNNIKKFKYVVIRENWIQVEDKFSCTLGITNFDVIVLYIPFTQQIVFYIDKEYLN